MEDTAHAPPAADQAEAPFIPIPNYPTGYPARTKRAGKAWQHAYDAMLATPAEFLDGVELAEKAAKSVRPHLSRETVISLLTRAATAELLERQHKPVMTGRGPRTRTFYRVPQGS